MGIFPSWKLTNIINQGFGPPSPQEGVTSCHWFRGWQVTTGIGFHIVSCCPLPTAREAERNIYLCKGGPLQHLGECPLFNITVDVLVLELIHMGRCTKWDIWKPPSWTLGVSEVETKKRTHEHASKVFQGVWLLYQGSCRRMSSPFSLKYSSGIPSSWSISKWIQPNTLTQLSAAVCAERTPIWPRCS